MTQQRTIRAPIVAILVFLVAAFIARSFLQLRLQDLGYNTLFAKDLSFLVVPLILALLMYPILKQHWKFLLSLFQREHLTLRLVIAAVAVGILMRIAWWSQLLARVSFGFMPAADPVLIAGPSFSFGCPPAHVILLGIFVMALLVPILEEVIDRGLIQSSFAHRGRTQAVLMSALVFTVFHPPAGLVATYIAGVIMGLQFWNTGTLWFSTITHATYNGLVQLDWRCVTGSWNPPATDLPLYVPGIISLGGLILSLAGIVFLIHRNRVGAH